MSKIIWNLEEKQQQSFTLAFRLSLELVASGTFESSKTRIDELHFVICFIGLLLFLFQISKYIRFYVLSNTSMKGCQKTLFWKIFHVYQPIWQLGRKMGEHPLLNPAIQVWFSSRTRQKVGHLLRLWHWNAQLQLLKKSFWYSKWPITPSTGLKWFLTFLLIEKGT